MFANRTCVKSRSLFYLHLFLLNRSCQPEQKSSSPGSMVHHSLGVTTHPQSAVGFLFCSWLQCDPKYVRMLGKTLFKAQNRIRFLGNAACPLFTVIHALDWLFTAVITGTGTGTDVLCATPVKEAQQGLYFGFWSKSEAMEQRKRQWHSPPDLSSTVTVCFWMVLDSRFWFFNCLHPNSTLSAGTEIIHFVGDPLSIKVHILWVNKSARKEHSNGL